MTIPPVFRTLSSDFLPDSPNSIPFWDDDHISAQMLAAHLDPSHDAASRRPALREATLKWLDDQVIRSVNPPLEVVDLGCGPGLYATALARKGLRVTGIDLSCRSIAYARDQATREGLSIKYRNESYLCLEDEARFDLALMIWCDMGALTNAERADVLVRIRRALRPGGTLVFDVWGTEFGDQATPSRTWSWNQGGFWTPRPHLLFEETIVKPGVQARRTVVWEEGAEPKVIYLRDYWFDDQSLGALVAGAGFEDVRVHRGVLGPGSDEGRVRFVSARR